VEALLRWHHPQTGLMPPAEFIPILEDTGLIDQVGEWIINDACSQVRSWDDQGYPPIRLAVNLSPRQISPDCIQNRLCNILRKTGIDPGRLELEITEHSLMEGEVEVIALLNSLGELGVSLAIDDFGTGYSSLSRLKQLPVHCLKIDRSLVRDIPQDANDQAICRAVVALGHSLGIRVIAEGVEQEEQAGFLSDIECDELQGFLYGKPMPADRLGEQLRLQRHSDRAVN